MDAESRRGLRVALASLLLVFVAAGGVNLVLDSPERWLSLHVMLDLLTYVIALAMAVVVWMAWWKAEHEVARVRESLEERRAERDEWRASARRALQGLAEAIDRQFETWGLTPTEREVALHLLKGKSHKAIARETDRSERTVRQHSVMVYQKAGLSGRAELAAYFLEDLMLPGGGDAIDRAASGD
jgi:DNA-binding CsgD family transcriptional regulator